MDSPEDISARVRRIGLATSLVADCYGNKVKVIEGVVARLPSLGMICGPELKVKTNGYILPILYAIGKAKPGDMLHVENAPGASNDALMGDIIFAECLRRGITGVICTGRVRDIPNAQQLNLPIWSAGHSPRAAKLGGPGDVDMNQQESSSRNWMFADGDGCVVVEGISVKELVIRCGLKKRKEERYIERIKESSLLQMMKVEAHVERGTPISIDF